MPADRESQIREVLRLIREEEKSENAACEIVGIARSTFRSMALKILTGDEYAQALAALAQEQVEKLEVTLEDMRSGKIDHNMARVEIDARKWFASKFLPKRYGDKIEIDATVKADVKVTIGGDA